MSQVEVLVWDYREQPDLARLAAVALELSRAGEVHLTAVKDTGCDEYALIVSDRPYEQAEASEAYRRRWEGEDG